LSRQQRPPLAQGELKLCSYTLESCAAAVLQRRVPRIPHVHLVRWFNDGPAGACPTLDMLKRAVNNDTKRISGCIGSHRIWSMTALRYKKCFPANKQFNGAAMKHTSACTVA